MENVDDENINFNESEPENGVEREVEDKETANIADPFDPSDIKISRRVITIDQVVRRIGYKEIDLAPDFQRLARIWDNKRKSQLIESILLRIPLPVFYVASDFMENWRVVDGLQRLTTISDFLSDHKDYAFKLSGLEYLSEFDGKYYYELPRGLLRRIYETELNINIIESGTPDRVMFNIFKRLNTGGMILNLQEIRHALNPGPARSFLIDLVNCDAFQLTTGGSINDKRMTAREMVLRFVAFHTTDFNDYQYNDLDSFLSDTMRKLNTISDHERYLIKNDFIKAMGRSFEIFDYLSFRKPTKNRSRRNPINKALFEAVSVNICKLSDEEFYSCQIFKEEIIDEIQYCLDNIYEFNSSISISTGNRNQVRFRFGLISDIFNKWGNML